MNFFRWCVCWQFLGLFHPLCIVAENFSKFYLFFRCQYFSRVLNSVDGIQIKVSLNWCPLRETVNTWRVKACWEMRFNTFEFSIRALRESKHFCNSINIERFRVFKAFLFLVTLTLSCREMKNETHAHVELQTRKFTWWTKINLFHFHFCGSPRCLIAWSHTDLNFPKTFAMKRRKH